MTDKTEESARVGMLDELITELVYRVNKASDKEMDAYKAYKASIRDHQQKEAAFEIAKIERRDVIVVLEAMRSMRAGKF